MEGFITAIDKHLLRVKTGEVHSTGQLRDAFRDWIESGMNADKPIVIDEEARPLSWLIENLWNCSDILPSNCCNELDIRRGSTYGQAVRNFRQISQANHVVRNDERGFVAGRPINEWKQSSQV